MLLSLKDGLFANDNTKSMCVCFQKKISTKTTVYVLRFHKLFLKYIMKWKVMLVRLKLHVKATSNLCKIAILLEFLYRQQSRRLYLLQIIHCCVSVFSYRVHFLALLIVPCFHFSEADTAWHIYLFCSIALAPLRTKS